MIYKFLSTLHIIRSMTCLLIEKTVLSTCTDFKKSLTCWFFRRRGTNNSASIYKFSFKTGKDVRVGYYSWQYGTRVRCCQRIAPFSQFSCIPWPGKDSAQTQVLTFKFNKLVIDITITWFEVEVVKLIIK